LTRSSEAPCDRPHRAPVCYPETMKSVDPLASQAADTPAPAVDPSAPPEGREGVVYEPSEMFNRAAPQPPAVTTAVASPSPAEPTPNPPLGGRRYRLPLILFLLTCLSTFLAGATAFNPLLFLLSAVGLGMQGNTIVPPSAMPLRRVILDHWENGLVYMACLLAILLTHEMGHFIFTVIYRVRASLPLFIPFPISPIGTMGAVIAMDGRSANRREIFDIGLAGPIAGLVVALPIMWIGVQEMKTFKKVAGEPTLPVPIVMRAAIDHFHPGEYNPEVGFPLSQANPWFMAGWVGLLVTGVNMLPVSQLDGGHVTYALFGRKAHWVARGFMGLVFGYMAYLVLVERTTPTWILMAVLVLFLGTDHPPTRDDSARLGWFRVLIGILSLAIPLFCLVPNLQLN
jgi:hypothetical protein